jgi:hypothetical protein
MHPISNRFARVCGFAVALSAALAQGSISWQGKTAPEVFGLGPDREAKDYTVQEIGCTGQSNVFWPGESVGFTLQLANQTNQPIKVRGQAEVIQYAMTTDPINWWGMIYRKVAQCGAVPIEVDLPAKGFIDLAIKPVQPKQFGAFVLVLDLPGHGRQFAAAYLYVPKADPGKVRSPTYAMDIQQTTDAMCGLFQRLGIKGTRVEVGYLPTDSKGFPKRFDQWTEMFAQFSKYDITAMLTLEGGAYETMPLGCIRSVLNDRNEGTGQYPGDFTWLPQYDEDFQKSVALLTGTFGWPKGPVNAVELWNEPWEGSSISGWAADIPRYREIYTKMALGVEEARRKQGVDVDMGGTCSSMNTEDKLFCDGKDTYLKWLDFNSIHYQPLGNVPALIPAWVQRQHPRGPVQAWDTETWIANSEDRVAAVIASMRAQGLQRTAGVLHDAVRTHQDVQIRTAAGPKRISVVQAWSPGAGIAGTQHFIGQRAFKEILFKNGLPWIFVFDGLPRPDGTPNPDDGTVVVVGDLGGVYERDLCKFRTVYGLANRAPVTAIQQELESLPAAATQADRNKVLRALKNAQVLSGATMTLPDNGGASQLFDFYGNPRAAQSGQIVVPLDGLGYFLRGDGRPGSFARLLSTLAEARIDGYEPLEMLAADMTAPVDRHPQIRLTLTNILNRPVAGTLTATLGGLTLESPSQPISLAAHQTASILLRVAGGKANQTNSYPLSLRFDAGKDGTAVLDEPLHANVIARRSIHIDGRLDDWQGVLPQIVACNRDSGPNQTEQAWQPLVNFPEKSGAGLTVAYLAYDEANFYFAAKVSDATPSGGELRIATRDDDQYFYPEKSSVVERDKTGEVTRRMEKTWPEGVRRFSYRRETFDYPCGGDAVQIAFNVLPQEKKGMLACPPGTMPQFMVYKDTDYEYYLHGVGAKWGGGTELWRLLAPGVPRKHFFPRQPKAEKDGGPVAGGQLAVVQQGATRIVECALPWSELPDVKAALDVGRNVKFSFRVTDDKGPSYELAAHRSVSKLNPLAFHEYWATHWANEVEFGFEK